MRSCELQLDESPFRLSKSPPEKTERPGRVLLPLRRVEKRPLRHRPYDDGVGWGLPIAGEPTLLVRNQGELPNTCDKALGPSHVSDVFVPESIPHHLFFRPEPEGQHQEECDEA